MVRGVVDGEEGGDAAEVGVGAVGGAEEDGDQRGLPVVGVEEVGDAEEFGGFEGGAAEEAEALGVVGVVAAGEWAIDAFTVEEVGAVDEVDLDAGVGAAGGAGRFEAAVEDAGEAVGGGERDGEAADEDGRFGGEFGDLAVAREVDGDAVAEGGEGGGQGGEDVAEAAGSGPGSALRGGEDDVHAGPFVVCISLAADRERWGRMGQKGKPKLGQNFLVDEGARVAIVDALGDVRGRTVIEIGPGHGALTELLAERAGRLVAIEVDRELAAELRFRFRNRSHVEVLVGDVLRTDLGALVPEGETADVVGNLPYYITSEILLRLFWASVGGGFRRAVLMMQREVAERVAARPGGREYGLLSATAGMYGEVEELFTLPPGAFEPPPEVYSTVVRMEFRARFGELGVDAEGFERYLRACFGQKRKTLANNLRAAGYGAEEIVAAWPEGLSRQARAEAVPLEIAAAMYRALQRATPPS